MAPSSSNGFETRSQGRAQRLSVDRRHASEALPCKSFEPIGRHVRIVRVTLQDCRLGRLRGQPTKHHVIAAWPLLASHVEAVVHLSSFRLEVKRTSEHGWDAARASLPLWGVIPRYPVLLEKVSCYPMTAA